MVEIDWDYSVSGALTPDVTGHFAEFGMHDGKTSYKHVDLEWYIWWQDPFNWVISTAIGVPGVAWWIFAGPGIVGVYTPQGTAIGNATVANGGD